jgi:HK97 family phage major capsid protein
VTLQADLITANEEVAAKQARMAELLKDINDLPADKARERADAIKSANLELAELGEKRDKLETDVIEIEKARDAVKSARRMSSRSIIPENDDETGEEDIYSTGVKTVRELLKNDAYRAAIKSGAKFRGSLGELAVKTLITSADLTPQGDRSAIIRPYATEERTVADLMLQGTTQAQVVEYFEETTFTNSAAETDEGALKPESALDFTLRQDSVRKIATWIPVTDEMMADVPAFESYLRERLGYSSCSAAPGPA